MIHYYSRIPAAALYQEIDGHTYAKVPHRLRSGQIFEDFKNYRILRFTEPESFIKNGEAHVFIGRTGYLVPVASCLPFGVSAIFRTGMDEVKS